MYMAKVPQVRAMTTERRIAETIPIAREVLMNDPSEEIESAASPEILKIETAMADPSRQKISETVVEVGSPSEL